MAVIIAPVEGYSGPGVGGLTFADGRAETDSEAVIAYARRHGYTVEDDDAPAEDTPPDSGDNAAANAPQDDKPAGRSRPKSTKEG
ncbi:hypothetical protein [Streptomyces griseosporeus]|uniref:hypothetical protein n=1 Tax=Streptomyces griseosporeus TaxID=1910 RepID=UPI0037015B3E